MTLFLNSWKFQFINFVYEGEHMTLFLNSWKFQFINFVYEERDSVTML
jgi:uncharacterized membrane protein YGL010W